MGKVSVGRSGKRETKVDNTNTAVALGSGSVEVYATPAMIALMEAAAVAAIAPSLAEGESSVGVSVEVNHLAATPLGQTVRAKADVVSVEGRRVTFQVWAWDGVELIGEGSHSRVIVELARFEAGLESKRRED